MKRTSFLPSFLLKYKFPSFLLSVAMLLVLSASPGSPLAKQNWGLLSMEIVVLAIILLFRDFEKSGVSSREVAIIAVLGALAAVARVPFTALPNVQPVTFLVIVSGYVFGARAGFMVGAIAALASNFFLGHGPWTPWQMFAWGMAGSSAAYFRAAFPCAGRLSMTALNFAWGYIFGWIMNLWTWTAFIYPMTWQSFAATYAASVPFDTVHAIGNAFFYLIFGEGTVRILQRVKKKMEISYIAVQDISGQPPENNS